MQELLHIAIFGGSFDPPHWGHLAVVGAALKSLDIHKLFIVPNFSNPFKQNTHFSPSLRLKWLNSLVQLQKWQDRVEVLDYEIRQHKPTPTLHTVKYLHSIYPFAKIYLIVGSDLLAHLHQWYGYEELKKEVEWVVFKRADCEILESFEGCFKLDVPFYTVSSTQIRRRDKEALEQIPTTIYEEVIERL